MERSGSQKALLVFSIIEIVAAVIALIGAVSTIMLTGAIAGINPADAGITANQQAAGGALFAVLSIAIVISAVWSLLCGIFGIRAANDNQKIMIVWVFTLIGVILAVIGIVVAIVDGSFGRNAITLIVGAIFDGVLFWLANNIKREAGK